jgi:large subunit ribosomal protein L7/L12
VALGVAAVVIRVFVVRRRAEDIHPPHPREPAARLDAAHERELRRLLAARQKIAAIRRYRELTGAGLKDAKDAVERLEAGLPRRP